MELDGGMHVSLCQTQSDTHTRANLYLSRPESTVCHPHRWQWCQSRSPSGARWTLTNNRLCKPISEHNRTQLYHYRETLFSSDMGTRKVANPHWRKVLQGIDDRPPSQKSQTDGENSHNGCTTARLHLWCCIQAGIIQHFPDALSYILEISPSINVV